MTLRLSLPSVEGASAKLPGFTFSDERAAAVSAGPPGEDRAMDRDGSPERREEDYYRSHWSRVYREDPSQLDGEWHCGYEKAIAAILPFVNRAAACAAAPMRGARDDPGDDGAVATTSGNAAPTGKVSARGNGLVVDVGCGSSSMGYEMWNDFHFGHLVLTDIDEGVLRTMRERFGTETNDDDDAEASEASEAASGDGYKKRTVRCVTCDARDMSAVGTASCAVVVDKGTLDALSGDDHKTAMLRECARICDFDNGGIIVSVSFAAAARVALLRQTSDALGLDVVTRVVGDGDPKFGNEAVFVSVLGRGLWDVAAGLARCELTETVLARVARSGSVIEDEPPDSGDELTLFDGDL